MNRLRFSIQSVPEWGHRERKIADGSKANTKTLLDIYDRLYAHFGPRHWWPAKDAFEVMVGAILTQNTAWSNVEKAIRNLRKKRLLSPRKMRKVPLRELATLIRPSGFYNEKAKKLKAFVKFLINLCGGSIKKLYPKDMSVLREKLLDVKGIGQETADSILLYALGKPIFVVDAYTKRIFTRHKLISENADYREIQNFFMDNIPKKVKFLNEYHALIVETGKSYCKKKKPFCKICPLRVAKYGKNMV